MTVHDYTMSKTDIVALYIIIRTINYGQHVLSQLTAPSSSLPLQDVISQLNLTVEKTNAWMEGTRCLPGTAAATGPGSNGTTSPFYCPLPWQDEGWSVCCGDECCVEEANFMSTGMQWVLGVGVVAGVILIGLAAVCLFNKCGHQCPGRSKQPDASPRTKVRVAALRSAVRPVDKRMLLQTGNYTVEKNWDDVIVKFNDKVFFNKFIEALLSRYREMTKYSAGRLDVMVLTSEGAPVHLRELAESSTLIVADRGNVAWVMNDFQNVLKNVRMPDSTEVASPCKRLTPRLPTIGEEFYDAGEFHVKITQTEIELKFCNSVNFSNFKRVLLNKYPTVPWSKYQQRDCAQVKVESGKNVTIHLWEDIASVWFSGDGKKEWYQTEFDQIWEKSKNGFMPEPTVVEPILPKMSVKRGFFSPLLSRASESSIKTANQMQSLAAKIPTVYTVKTLDTGGIEIEFNTAKFLPIMKELISAEYAIPKWKEFSCRSVTSIDISKSQTMSVHISSAISNLRKMWLYEEHCKHWFNTRFKAFYAEAFWTIYPPEESTPENNDVMVPIDSSV